MAPPEIIFAYAGLQPVFVWLAIGVISALFFADTGPATCLMNRAAFELRIKKDTESVAATGIVPIPLVVASGCRLIAY